MRVNNNSLELVILYLRYRNSFNFGYQKFMIWRNMIRFITGVNDPKIIRKIFYHLLNTNQFSKNKIGPSTFYIFNPTGRPIIINDKVTFD